MAARIEGPARRRIGIGAAVVLVVVTAAVAVTIGMVRSATTPAVIDIAPTAEGVVDALPAVYVHIYGAVAAPGLYRVDEGARVVDVIAAAGGLTEDADPTAVNLARRVADGEQLRVPAVGEAPPASAGPAESAPEAPSDGRVNLNTADAAALDTLPRVGPAIAERIIQWRDANGAFTSVDDLLAVPGIGEKMLAALRDLVTV